MKIIDTIIPDVKIIEPMVFNDERGFFYESFNQKIFEQVIGQKKDFVQDNHSKSHRGVVRGLHFQVSPWEQGKLVRCIVGEVFDVAVDIRKNSPTFGHWVSAHLSANNKRQLWLPEGFAHGFLTLSQTAELLYKTTNYYNQKAERCIAWNDSTLSINWPQLDSIISDKDKNGLILQECASKIY